MIDALAQAAGVLGEPRYLRGRAKGGRVPPVARCDRPTAGCCTSGAKARRSSTRTSTTTPAWPTALVTLYEADFDERWIDEAIGRGRYHVAAVRRRSPRRVLLHGHRPRAADHAAERSATTTPFPAATRWRRLALLRLGKLTGRDDYLAAAERTLDAAAPVMRQAPRASGQMLIALDLQLGPTPEIVIVGDPANADTSAALAALRRRYMPNRVVACRLPGASPPHVAAGPAVRGQGRRRRPADRVHLRALRLPGPAGWQAGCHRRLGKVGRRASPDLIPGGWSRRVPLRRVPLLPSAVLA